jgi:CHAD domain-containing protein
MRKLGKSNDADAVHDARVLSRRLQQGVGALFPKPRPGKVRRFRRRLRRTRRALGDWRNSDVLIELVQRRLARTRNPAGKRAWRAVRDDLENKRGAHIASARATLGRWDFKELSAPLKKLIESDEARRREASPAQDLRPRIDAAWTEWEAALAQARATQSAADIHRFRIAGKKLRYRMELLHELGEKDTAPSLKFLKKLQSELGKWHDREVLFQAAAEAIARPELLLRGSDIARVLLREIDAERVRQRKKMEKIFALAEKRPETEKNPAPGGPEPGVSSSR